MIVRVNHKNLYNKIKRVNHKKTISSLRGRVKKMKGQRQSRKGEPGKKWEGKRQ